jgi:predicted O-linked N-acetylglucosamine transferase (SPINDLY family)
MKTFDELLREGYFLQHQRRLEEAASVYRELARRHPNDARLANLLALVRADQGRWEESLSQAEKAVRLDPANAAYHVQRALALNGRGRRGEAVEALARGCELDPEVPRGLSLLIQYATSVGDWHDFDRRVAELVALVRSGRGVVEALSLFSVCDDPADHLACARALLNETQANFRSLVPAVPFTHDRRRRREKIRVGYLSADFRAHAVANLVVELIELHDRSRFEVVGISIGPDDRGAKRKRLKAGFDRFIDALDWPLPQFADRLRGVELDVLVDLMGHTEFNQIGFLASRPAPIQANFLGFPGTTGADFIDYILVDSFIVPPGHAPFFSEKLVHLPDSYQPNDRKRAIAERTPSRAECGLPEGVFVFCCFNRTEKITPHVFEVWMRILGAVPGSVLWLFRTGDTAESNLRREAEARGVDPGRLVFAPPLPAAEHLARYRLVDLVLDTLPYNLHTSASDALWAGVPIVTCAGKSFPARVAGSLLHATGLPELVVHSLADYETLAVKLARDPAQLRLYRERIVANRDRSPLFDTPRYCAHIEKAYETMMDIWRSGEKPRSFAIEPIGSPA